MQHLRGSLYLSNARERVELGRNAAVRTEDLLAHNSGARHAVEAIAEDAPQPHIIASEGWHGREGTVTGE